jgi:hypothetical protein
MQPPANLMAIVKRTSPALCLVFKLPYGSPFTDSGTEEHIPYNACDTLSDDRYFMGALMYANWAHLTSSFAQSRTKCIQSQPTSTCPPQRGQVCQSAASPSFILVFHIRGKPPSRQSTNQCTPSTRSGYPTEIHRKSRVAPNWNLLYQPVKDVKCTPSTEKRFSRAHSLTSLTKIHHAPSSDFLLPITTS